MPEPQDNIVQSRCPHRSDYLLMQAKWCVVNKISKQFFARSIYENANGCKNEDQYVWQIQAPVGCECDVITGSEVAVTK